MGEGIQCDYTACVSQRQIDTVNQYQKMIVPPIMLIVATDLGIRTGLIRMTHRDNASDYQYRKKEEPFGKGNRKLCFFRTGEINLLSVIRKGVDRASNGGAGR